MAKLHITEINGEKFVLGLFWQSITPGKDNKKEARKIGDELNQDLLIIRDGENLQAGYGSTKDGAKSGHYSLAAAITKGASEIGITGSWIGVFKLPDGTYAFIATNEGMFLPDGDFGGAADEVRDKLLKAFSFGLDWTHIIVPEEFISTVGKGEFKPLDDFLPKRKGKIKIHKWWALESVKPTVPVGKILSVIVFAGIAAYGYYAYTQYEEKKAAEEQARRLEIARQMFAQQQVSGEHLAHPWATQIYSSDFINHCISNVQNKYITPGYWKLERVTCTPSNIEYAWDRNKSNINKLLVLMPSAVVDASGDKATMTLPIVMEGQKTDEETTSSLIAKSNFLSYFQARALSVKLTEQAPPPMPPPVPGSAPEAQPIRDWKTYEFQIQSDFSPSKFKEVFTYPVTRLTKVELKLGNGKDTKTKWTVDGMIYTKQ